MFKFNPVKHKINILKEIADLTPKDGNESLFNHHDKFKDDTNKSSNSSAYDQFNTIIIETSLYIHFLISTTDNAALKKNSFCSNYKIRTINNLSQSLDFEVIKIIESSLSTHHNQFYKVLPLENLIGLHYGGYSASYIEIEYSNYLYSIFQSLRTMSTLNSDDYKTPNGNHVLKQDNSLAIENIGSYLIYEFQSLQTTKINDAITFNMNKISMLNDMITNIETQLKDIRDSVEEGINLSEEIINIEMIQQNLIDATNASIGECNEFESLYLNTICKDVNILMKGISEFNIRFCDAYEIGVKEVPYSRENKIKFPGRHRI
ncbi:10660_t:CDS:1 [Gigaspora margarita]|uniref:10660_t:CDS:1 n=1 Tax=Gigaspora margarita TaxID=4874 RepID=A0ABM8W6S3_GIGMA|nr:10660_t:CDS:1 [Gigaspora margarita]